MLMNGWTLYIKNLMYIPSIFFWLPKQKVNTIKTQIFITPNFSSSLKPLLQNIKQVFIHHGLVVTIRHIWKKKNNGWRLFLKKKLPVPDKPIYALLSLI